LVYIGALHPRCYSLFAGLVRIGADLKPSTRNQQEKIAADRLALIRISVWQLCYFFLARYISMRQVGLSVFREGKVSYLTWRLANQLTWFPPLFCNIEAQYIYSTAHVTSKAIFHTSSTGLKS
jgi:hypothetical protein